MRLAKISTSMARYIAAAAVGIVGVSTIIATGGGSSATFNPAATTFTTFALKGGTIDSTGPCTPPTPPASADPSPPGAAQVLVGDQDWRNTLKDTSGNQCQTSNAKRFEGSIGFDMSAVIANINSAAFNTLTGTITYKVGSTLSVPQSAQAFDLCVASLELAATAPTTGGVVPLNFLNNENFPASAPPSLGARTLPSSAPYGSVTNTGGVTVDPAPPNPTVTADLSLMLSDWVKSKAPVMAVVFVPQGPTLAAMGIGSGTPVPVSRSTAQCTSILESVSLTVNVGRD